MSGRKGKSFVPILQYKGAIDRQTLQKLQEQVEVNAEEEEEDVDSLLERRKRKRKNAGTQDRPQKRAKLGPSDVSVANTIAPSHSNTQPAPTQISLVEPESLDDILEVSPATQPSALSQYMRADPNIFKSLVALRENEAARREVLHSQPWEGISVATDGSMLEGAADMRQPANDCTTLTIRMEGEEGEVRVRMKNTEQFQRAYQAYSQVKHLASPELLQLRFDGLLLDREKTPYDYFMSDTAIVVARMPRAKPAAEADEDKVELGEAEGKAKETPPSEDEDSRGASRVLIKVRMEGGAPPAKFKLLRTDPLSKVAEAVARQRGVAAVMLTFDGMKITSTQTPDDLDLEDGDLLDAMAVK